MERGASESCGAEDHGQRIVTGEPNDPRGEPKAVPAGGAAHTPSRQDRLRPTELLVISGILALFTGLVVLLATREFILAGISLGIAFIVALVGLAMFSLTFKPNATELTDIEEQDRGE
jgi:hypothetical protein